MKYMVLAMLVVLSLGIYSLSEASILYSFDVTVNYSAIKCDAEKIQGVEFTISGTQGIDWVFNRFRSPYDGTWFFDKTGILDDVYLPGSIGTSAPLNSGTIFTLISPNDSLITISGLVPYDYGDNDFDPQVFGAQLNVAPIPGAVWFLGSGLVGLFGIRRRIQKT